MRILRGGGNFFKGLPELVGKTDTGDSCAGCSVAVCLSVWGDLAVGFLASCGFEDLWMECMLGVSGGLVELGWEG